jgi:Tol biopolymer transport system component
MDYRFLQVFYPTRGILEWYDRATGLRNPLPGADDPRYVQTDGVWSPDGKYIVFARAEALAPRSPGQPRRCAPTTPTKRRSSTTSTASPSTTARAAGPSASWAPLRTA